MIYWITRIILWPFVQILFLFSRLKNAHKVPREGATILICNHYSLFDPVLLTFLIGRRIYFMAKAELFKSKFSNWFFRKVGAFPVYRGAADVNAMKNALAVLRRGDMLGIFPEGTRQKSGSLGKFEPGVALFALKSKAKVVPVAILNQYAIFRRAAFLVGDEVDLTEFIGKHPTAEVLLAVAQKMRSAVETLITENKKT
ncbi:MAG: lysophospholipid acyltransferase family protein [Christensenellales bacterium]